MKRIISLGIALVLSILLFCGCEENPQRATCTISASNGFTTVKCAFECTGHYSSTWHATNAPVFVTFDQPGSLCYKFACPACGCLLEDSLNTGNSVFLRCDCDENPQAIVISAVFSESTTNPSTPVTESLETPKYELEG